MPARNNHVEYDTAAVIGAELVDDAIAACVFLFILHDAVDAVDVLELVFVRAARRRRIVVFSHSADSAERYGYAVVRSDEH